MRRRFHVSLVISALLLLALGYGVADADLVAHWDFNEAAGDTAHDAINGLHGVLEACARWSEDGVCGTGGSIYLDVSEPANPLGTGFVNMGDPPLLEFTGAFSVSTWIKVCPNSGASIPLSRHRGTFIYNGYFLYQGTASCYGQPDRGWFYAYCPCGTEPISSSVVNDSEWRYLVGTHEPGGLTSIYVDGVLEDSKPSQPLDLRDAFFLIGGVTLPDGIANGGFRGLIDDVRVYDHALDPTEVADNYQQCAPTGPPIALDCQPCGTVAVETPGDAAPGDPLLSRNRPNPFSPATSIEFELAAPDHVSLRIYDTSGRMVRTLIDAELTGDRYTLEWDGRDDRGTQAPAGTYFYSLQVGTQREVRKMVMLK